MKKIIFFLLIICYNPLLSQSKNLIPTIEYSTQEESISLKSTVLNKENIVVDLNYLFLVIKEQNGNLSNKQQQGKFIVEPNEKKNLSEIKLNFDENTSLKAYLFIRDENQNKLIAKDSLHLDLKDKANLNNPIDRILNRTEYKGEQFIIRGLVTDNTKTKMGRDFYEIFYENYNLLDEKFPFIIEIVEQPLMGRNSMMNIIADDKTIFSFNLTPNQYTMREINADLFRNLFMYNRNRTIINSY